MFCFFYHFPFYSSIVYKEMKEAGEAIKCIVTLIQPNLQLRSAQRYRALELWNRLI